MYFTTKDTKDTKGKNKSKKRVFTKFFEHKYKYKNEFSRSIKIKLFVLFVLFVSFVVSNLFNLIDQKPETDGR
jgi:hypothetical protein